MGGLRLRHVHCRAGELQNMAMAVKLFRTPLAECLLCLPSRTSVRRQAQKYVQRPRQCR